MLKELYTAAMGMLPQQTRLESIANNIANAGTTGFKRQSVFERNLIDARANFYNVPGDAEQNDPPVGSYTDFSAGAMQKTDNPLDIAIDTENGFFVLQDEDGNNYLTRRGNFKLDKDGNIVTMDGKYLLGNDGILNVYKDFNQEQLDYTDANALNLKINENGECFTNETYIGTVEIAKPSNLQTLENISNSDFIVREDTDIEILTPEQITLRQGWLENSNVNIVDEMVKMIELQRMFEAGTKVIQTNDGTLDTSIKMGRYY
ncbi:MAG TPA: flagellar hook-basal body protein [Candidatus Kapabacteria bacterium]|nr:flagellar hook-basal body protein [Candidatus Kapabacteria bacterium]